MSFQEVHRDCIGGVFSNEAGLRQAFVEALKVELKSSQCHKYIVEHWFIPSLDETIKRGRPDIRISNLVIEVEPPNSGLGEGRKQLEQYMEELYEKVKGRVEVYGLVTDGSEAEMFRRDDRGPSLVQRGDMPLVARNLLNLFCSSKIPIVNPEDLVRLFGV